MDDDSELGWVLGCCAFLLFIPLAYMAQALQEMNEESQSHCEVKADD